MRRVLILSPKSKNTLKANIKMIGLISRVQKAFTSRYLGLYFRHSSRLVIFYGMKPRAVVPGGKSRSLFQLAPIILLWKLPIFIGELFSAMWMYLIQRWYSSPHTIQNNFCIVGAFTNIEKSHTQTARPYKNLYGRGLVWPWYLSWT